MLFFLSRRALRVWRSFQENTDVRDSSVLQIEPLWRLGFQADAIDRDSEKFSDFCANGTGMGADFRRGQNEA